MEPTGATRYSALPMLSVNFAKTDEVVKFMKRYVGCLFLVSIAYWLWALHNIMDYVHNGGIISIDRFDYGVVTFFTVGVSCIAFFIRCIPIMETSAPLPRFTHVWFPLPQLLVSYNYISFLIKTIDVAPWNKILYYGSFGLGWLGVSIASYRLVKKWENFLPRGDSLADGAGKRYMAMGD